MLNGKKEKSEAQRGKPKGTLESEIRLVCVCITKTEKAESEAQRGRPKGTLESESRNAIV